MNIIDLHCDTLDKMFNSEETLYNGDLSVNIEKMIQGNYMAQFFATFFELDKEKYPFEVANLMIDKFFTEIEENKENISLTLNYQDILNNKNNKKISALLTIEEGGGAIEGSIKNIEHFYKRGVRLIGLTWNFENSIGYPHLGEGLPLKKFGKDAVEYMNDLGIIVDVSHLSDKGFYDVYEIVKSCNKPFVASHSNAREITNHSRNLTDDMIKKIGESGGIIGLNFASQFLGNSEIAKIEDMIKHLKHIKNKGGIDVLALGSDFDGIPNEVELKDASYMQYIEDILRKNKISFNEIEKIMHKNTLRVIKDVLG